MSGVPFEGSVRQRGGISKRAGSLSKDLVDWSLAPRRRSPMRRSFQCAPERGIIADMNRDDIERKIADHGIETVKIGTPDMDGVYRGKRVSAKQFVEGCEGDGFAQCDVLFGWDIAEEVMTGLDLAIGSADTGFADILLRPDLRTFRIVPWEPATAAVVCDAYTEAGDLVPQSPRTVLRRVIERARGMGFDPAMAVELEFRIFREDQESLRAKRYSDLRPLNPGYNCYSMVLDVGPEDAGPGSGDAAPGDRGRRPALPGRVRPGPRRRDRVAGRGDHLRGHPHLPVMAASC